MGMLKDEQLRGMRKDEQLEQANKEYKAMMERIIVLKEFAFDRQRMLQGLLADKGVRELRGVLEILAGLTSFNTTFLCEKLAKDEGFNRFLNIAALVLQLRNTQIRNDDIVRCVKVMYHTLSAGQHGTTPGSIVVRLGEKLEKNQVAAFCLMLEFFKVKYTLLDESGAELQGAYSVPDWPGHSFDRFRHS